MTVSSNRTEHVWKDELHESQTSLRVYSSDSNFEFFRISDLGIGFQMGIRITRPSDTRLIARSSAMGAFARFAQGFEI